MRADTLLSLKIILEIAKIATSIMPGRNIREAMSTSRQSGNIAISMNGRSLPARLLLAPGAQESADGGNFEPMTMDAIAGKGFGRLKFALPIRFGWMNREPGFGENGVIGNASFLLAIAGIIAGGSKF